MTKDKMFKLFEILDKNYYDFCMTNGQDTDNHSEKYAKYLLEKYKDKSVLKIDIEMFPIPFKNISHGIELFFLEDKNADVFDNEKIRECVWNAIIEQKTNDKKQEMNLSATISKQTVSAYMEGFTHIIDDRSYHWDGHYLDVLPEFDMDEYDK